ncbi:MULTISPECIES: sensor histidine kinase [Pseudomonas]|uniref:sensor histidine kinase n=2 Tax=Pseudomonas TaxID=286 RepID=UPI00224AEBD1|nr:HAMP domain-containing sensor histidine kinase [Pseudomonas sp. DCB_BI]MCX2891182.1 HAMP domain-containing sensor histidine kinase [Pseudomonas sp. DCB_BI]
MKPSLWRTTAFRLTVSYAGVLALAMMVLLALIYWRSTDYFSQIGETFVVGQARSLLHVPPVELPRELEQLQRGDIRGIAHYGLFSRDAHYIAGNIKHLPSDLPLDGMPRALNEPGFEFGAKASAQVVANGDILVVGYDAKTLSGISDMLLALLLWSGGLSIAGGIGLGAILGLRPLRRVKTVQYTSQRIAEGNLGLRLPLSRRGDELDALSALVNQMMDEVEHLMGEVRSVGNNLAHDLRTPLNRLRAQLRRTIEDFHSESPERQLSRLHEAFDATEQLLTRFRAIQRIAEIDTHSRRAGMKMLDPGSLISLLAADFKPVAEECGVTLLVDVQAGPPLLADDELLMEALINLLDNALKFTPVGGTIRVALEQSTSGSNLIVEDDGPGIPAEDRDHVLLRFGRCSRDQQVLGAGLGLAIVAAIVRLHGFQLRLEDASPGLRAVIQCARGR